MKKKKLLTRDWFVFRSPLEIKLNKNKKIRGVYSTLPCHLTFDLSHRTPNHSHVTSDYQHLTSKRRPGSDGNGPGKFY